jgi:high-affinity nickel-transport protein
MPNIFLRLFNDGAANARGKVVGIYLVLIATNAAAWAWAFVAFHNYPALLGTGFLAYSFGLRHAVDADHIAAIDNVTRKLMQEGQRPAAVGFFFSLGHSTVVVWRQSPLLRRQLLSRIDWKRFMRWAASSAPRYRRLFCS